MLVFKSRFSTVPKSGVNDILERLLEEKETKNLSSLLIFQLRRKALQIGQKYYALINLWFHHKQQISYDQLLKVALGLLGRDKKSEKRQQDTDGKHEDTEYRIKTHNQIKIPQKFLNHLNILQQPIIKPSKQKEMDNKIEKIDERQKKFQCQKELSKQRNDPMIIKKVENSRIKSKRETKRHYYCTS